uniref:AP2/ERF domain-containing protein n=1 Tax=Musa acuminata subsp. malaccensis TaxID=214687 RepID=A0A804K4G3_MUSAM|nr:PREDICTED: AP2-like ethylene-responsive transcription factor BBM2 [Musa acuminata subsp. malaccensis]
MNNWLAFSLSPQELPPSQSHQSNSPSAAVSHLISGDDVSASCYGLSADSTSEPPMGIPTLRPDVPFGVLEAFNRPYHQTQDWNMKCLDFKGGSSELSMLVGSSSTNQSNMVEDQPKLEDFLGGNSFSDHDHKVLPAGLSGAYSSSGDEYMFSNSSFQVQDTSMVTSTAHDGALMNDANGGSSSNSIGLSMIKTWLRNQPNIPQQQASINSSNDMAGVTGTNCGGAMMADVIGSLTNSQGLSLSMSTGSQSSSALPLLAAGPSGGGESSSSDNKQKGIGGSLDAQTGAMEAVSRKSVDTFGQRTSIYRGVTRHRWTGRYEAHLWDNSCRREGQTRKGRQVYLGGYDKEEKAARAYDLAALKYWGPTTTTNFPISNYEKELEEMKHMTRQEFVASLRRKSSGFSRGASIYRGVTRHHQHGRWQARIGRVAGNKDLYLGTFSTQEEAAEAYDIAAIKFRGLNAVTNFDMSRYDVKSILESNTLPIGGAAKRLKDVAEHAEASVNGRGAADHHHLASQFDGISGYGSLRHHGWPAIAFHQPQPLGVQYPYGLPRGWCKQEQDTAVAAAHSLQDLHQLHLGTNTHDFFQPSSALHNLVSISTESSSVVYNGNMASSSGSYQGGYVMPMSTVVTDQSHTANRGSCGATFVDDEGKQIGYDSSLNAYYLSQQLSSGDAAKGDEYEQSSTWTPASAQAMASRSNTMAAAGHAAPLFTVWNDA